MIKHKSLVRKLPAESQCSTSQNQWVNLYITLNLCEFFWI